MHNTVFRSNLHQYQRGPDMWRPLQYFMSFTLGCTMQLYTAKVVAETIHSEVFTSIDLLVSVLLAFQSWHIWTHWAASEHRVAGLWGFLLFTLWFCFVAGILFFFQILINCLLKPPDLWILWGYIYPSCYGNGTLEIKWNICWRDKINCCLGFGTNTTGEITCH